MLDSAGNEGSVYALVRGRFSGMGRIRLHMTAMIDVIFLLLVFFVLTAEFDLPEQFIDLRLPAKSGAVRGAGLVEPMEVVISSAGEGVTVEVGGFRDVRIQNDGLEAGLGELYEVFGEVMESQHRVLSDPVHIVCDEDVSWDHLAKIYNLLGVCGMENVTFVLDGRDK